MRDCAYKLLNRNTVKLIFGTPFIVRFQSNSANVSDEQLCCWLCYRQQQKKMT